MKDFNFDIKDKYTTTDVKDKICLNLQFDMWFSVEIMEVEHKSNIQMFKLEPAKKGNRLCQKIIHTQEKPDYRKEAYLELPEKDIVDTQVCIYNDGYRSVMLLAEDL